MDNVKFSIIAALDGTKFLIIDKKLDNLLSIPAWKVEETQEPWRFDLSTFAY
jgi:hypothetical protein